MDAKHYGDVDGMDGDGGDAAVADEDRCLSLPDLRRTKMDLPVDEFPLQIPSGGEVSAISEFLVNSKLTIFLIFGSFLLRHDWSKNYVHCIHHLS